MRPDVVPARWQALVASPAQHSRDIVAVARFIRSKHVRADAELAITVADPWHRRGLAAALLTMLSDHARAVGIRRFTADMLADSSAVRALVRAAGGTGERFEGPIVNAHISLSPVVVSVSDSVLLRTAAEQVVLPVPQALATAVPELRPGARAIVSLDIRR